MKATSVVGVVTYTTKPPYVASSARPAAASGRAPAEVDHAGSAQVAMGAHDAPPRGAFRQRAAATSHDELGASRRREPSPLESATHSRSAVSHTSAETSAAAALPGAAVHAVAFNSGRELAAAAAGGAALKAPMRAAPQPAPATHPLLPCAA